MIFDNESPKLIDKVSQDRNFIRKMMFNVYEIDEQERKFNEFNNDKNKFTVKPRQFDFKNILKGKNPIKLKDEVEFNKLKEVKLELAR